jgi:hypothetical protein
MGRVSGPIGIPALQSREEVKPNVDGLLGFRRDRPDDSTFRAVTGPGGGLLPKLRAAHAR